MDSAARYRMRVLRRVARGHAWGGKRGWELRREFSALRRFVVFVGYSRSGHSLVAALLDAHRRAAIAHEEGALLLAHARVPRGSILGALAANTRDIGHTRGHTGGRLEGYVYGVPGQWQGRWERLEVVGDKHGEDNAWRLVANPRLGERLERCVGVPIEWIHVVRNPFDNVATVVKRSGLAGDAREVTAAANRYAGLSRGLEAILVSLDPRRVHTVQHERFVDDPCAGLGTLCSALGLETDDEYLKACAAIVFAEPRRTRTTVEWGPEASQVLADRIADSRALRGYGFEEPTTRSTR